jgi:hypothetical protein
VYSVFTKLGDGEFLFVASRDELEQAAALMEELAPGTACGPRLLRAVFKHLFSTPIDIRKPTAR